MTNLGLELLILTVSLIYFGVFITQNLYEQGKRAHLRKNNFCSKSITNPYCIVE